jgi:hypothetical protein
MRNTNGFELGEVHEEDILEVIERFISQAGTFRRTVEAAYIAGYRRALEETEEIEETEDDLQST